MKTREVDALADTLRDTLPVCHIDRRRRNLSVRCPYCGDSIKNPYHAHLNIRIYDPEALVWRCVRCESKGIVNPEFLRDLKCYDSKSLAIAQLNAMASKRKFKVNLKGASTFPRLTFPYSNSKNAKRKIDYLNYRLGTSLTLNDSPEFKIVTDLEKFFKVNRLPPPTNKGAWKVFDRLDQEGVGFLSSDFSTICFRDVTGTWNKRYYAFEIYKDNPLARGLYTVRSQVDLLAKEVTLVLAEGVFDILGVKLCIADELGLNFDDIVFCTTEGKSFKRAINWIRAKGFLDINVVIFSDKDLGKGFYAKMKREDILLKSSPLEVWYNDFPNKKDFGVPRDEMKPRKVIL